MVSIMYNDVVTLLVEKTIRDEIGMKQTFYEEREVFAEELPINQSEFFKCRETGLRPALCLRIPYGEYEQEEVLRFGGRLYSVYRFRNDFHHTELYCEARSGLYEHKG